MLIKPLALTMGDPTGIASELTIKAWHALKNSDDIFFWIGAPSLIKDLVPYKEINSPEEAASIFPNALPVIALSDDFPKEHFSLGKPSARYAPFIIQSIEKAVTYSLEGHASGVVTNPIAKHILAEYGFQYPGHTEFLSALCKTEGEEMMMLASPDLKVILTTIHVSLKDAINSLTKERIIKTALCAYHALKEKFNIPNPRIAIAGLNPHAGENGLMGREEIEIIKPACDTLKEQGINILGPLPPDTMFNHFSRKTYDVAVCLYHDQGLIPLKTLDMENGVNITLGLPIIRTSPDHGTAFNIAGKNIASPQSLISSIKLAKMMASHTRYGENI